MATYIIGSAEYNKNGAEVARTTSYDHAAALAKLESVSHGGAPSTIRRSDKPGKAGVVYYGADIGETIEAARAMVAQTESEAKKMATTRLTKKAYMQHFYPALGPGRKMIVDRVHVDIRFRDDPSEKNGSQHTFSSWGEAVKWVAEFISACDRLEWIKSIDLSGEPTVQR